MDDFFVTIFYMIFSAIYKEEYTHNGNTTKRG